MKDFREDVLEHYGVLGMHWGRRKGGIGSFKKAYLKTKAKGHTVLGKINRNAAKSHRANAKDFSNQREKLTGLKDAFGRQALSNKDIDTIIAGLKTGAKKHDLKAKGHEKFAKQLLSEIGGKKVSELKNKK